MAVVFVFVGTVEARFRPDLRVELLSTRFFLSHLHSRSSDWPFVWGLYGIRYSIDAFWAYIFRGTVFSWIES